MRGIFSIVAAAGICVLHGPASADASAVFQPPLAAANSSELPPYLQCVPYARQLSGVQIYGDALTWWDQAAGRYERGDEPRTGAVMTFVPSGNMRLGHVATVSRVIDSRTVLLDHANWSPINGRRGQIERGVKAVDVSPGNDWSQVRVWYDPIRGLGTTAWPVSGFIYGTETRSPATRLAAVSPRATALTTKPVSAAPSPAFANAFSGIAAPIARTTLAAANPAPVRKPMPQRKQAPAPAKRDPIAAAIARY